MGREKKSSLKGDNNCKLRVIIRKFFNTKTGRKKQELKEKLYWLGTYMTVTVAERSKAWTVFARSEAGIVGSNPKQHMDVLYVFILCLRSIVFR
jgi:hypothetical protein